MTDPSHDFDDFVRRTLLDPFPDGRVARRRRDPGHLGPFLAAMELCLWVGAVTFWVWPPIQ